MKNLRGNSRADDCIQEELATAGIPFVEVKRNFRDFPHSYIGRLSNWTFQRTPCDWRAYVHDGDGLPLEIAAQLHERQYPIVGEGQPKTYGRVIRVFGDCGCPHPSRWAMPSMATLREVMKSSWKENATYDELAIMLDGRKFEGQKFSYVYHIDTQPALNEFARVVRSVK